MLVDSHAHLEMPQFDPDREEVIQRARAAGVAVILTIGSGNPEGTAVESTLKLAARHEFIYAGIGVHPHDASRVSDSYWERMQEWSEDPRVVVWGEIGLDYYYDHSPRETQRLAFRRQLGMARERGLPVSIHCRDAWDDLIPLLKQEWTGENRGVMHSFTGDAEQARACLDLGFLISFSGILTFKNAERLRSVARSLSPSQVLVETDSPYLAPVPHRGKRNEPAFVVEVARVLAEVMEVDLETLSRAMSENFARLTRVDLGRIEAGRLDL